MGNPNAAPRLADEIAIARRAVEANRKAAEEFRKVAKELGDILRRRRARRQAK